MMPPIESRTDKELFFKCENMLNLYIGEVVANNWNRSSNKGNNMEESGKKDWKAIPGLSVEICQEYEQKEQASETK